MDYYLSLVMALFTLQVNAQDQASLTLYLPLDGPAVDASQYQHVLIRDGGTAASDRKGKPSGALRLDGFSESIVISDDNIIPANDFTIAGWINFTGTRTSQQTSQVINKYRWDDGERNFRVACEVGLLKMRVWYATGLSDAKEVATPLPENEWVHFATTLSSTNMLRLFLNGCLVSSKQLPGPMALGREPIRIGNATNYGSLLPGDNHHFNGLLDEIRVYSVEMEATEIEKLAEQQPLTELPSAELRLTFNGSLTDSSEQAHIFVGEEVSFGQGLLDSVAGGALAFDGSTTELVLANHNLIQENDFSVAGWFNFGGVRSSQQTATILSKYTWDDGERNFRLECFENHLTLYVWYGFTLEERMEISAPITLNEWHHFVFTLSAGNFLTLYLNGCLMGARQLPAPMRLGSQPLIIGNSDKLGETLPGDNHHFNGLLDELQIYARALTPCELSGLAPSPLINDINTSLRTFSDLDLEVFPNPTSSLLYVGSMRQDLHFDLFDLQGRRLTLIRTANSIDLSALARGTYLLRVISSDGDSGITRIVRQ